MWNLMDFYDKATWTPGAKFSLGSRRARLCDQLAQCNWKSLCEFNLTFAVGDCKQMLTFNVHFRFFFVTFSTASNNVSLFDRHYSCLVIIFHLAGLLVEIRGEIWSEQILSISMELAYLSIAIHFHLLLVQNLILNVSTKWIYRVLRIIWYSSSGIIISTGRIRDISNDMHLLMTCVIRKLIFIRLHKTFWPPSNSRSRI